MNRRVMFLLLYVISQLFLSMSVYAQQYSKYNIAFEVARSNDTAFTNFIMIAPYPQTCEYQDVYALDIRSMGDWELGEISENDNKFLGLYLNETRLKGYTRNFSVGFGFIHSPKNIDVDFSKFRNPDGSWKDIPEYDKTTRDYKDNCKRSGDIVDPENSTIQMISDKLFNESNGNKLDYAERCYNYVATHYRYLNPNTGLHSLTELLSVGGGDCGNLSSIYISLLRAKGIPARHVVAIADKNNYHVWAEFYIQDFGWVPVDVTYKNANPQGNYFGKYDNNMVVVQKGVSMAYPISWYRNQTIDLLQTFCYWYWYSTFATISINQKITSETVNYDGCMIDELSPLHKRDSKAD